MGLNFYVKFIRSRQLILLYYSYLHMVPVFSKKPKLLLCRCIQILERHKILGNKKTHTFHCTKLKVRQKS